MPSFSHNSEHYHLENLTQKISKRKCTTCFEQFNANLTDCSHMTRTTGWKPHGHFI
ncbi:hypothetical protein B0F90DRAFT_1926683 [Multifurca ochricompacta]|uniref:Uncharacterized protein n=1 Tax=Multifurca ochricompacta TaxID=376703 RepID=A0AAD4M136_9AGAM|nr:hypothetical protein B0F90DRAFT_1926683 [Multifurca ochricompacta]